MADDTVVVIGLDAVKQQFLNASSKVRSKLRAAAVLLAEEVRDRAQAIVPVGKKNGGKLKRSIRSRITETDKLLTVSTAATRFTARFIESGVVNHGGANNRRLVRGNKAFEYHRVRKLRALGAWRVKPHPFMGPAMAAVAPKIQPALEQAIAEAVAEVN
jgi:HK97 gp10 family phage protein